MRVLATRLYDLGNVLRAMLGILDLGEDLVLEGQPMNRAEFEHQIAALLESGVSLTDDYVVVECQRQDPETGEIRVAMELCTRARAQERMSE